MATMKYLPSMSVKSAVANVKTVHKQLGIESSFLAFLSLFSFAQLWLAMLLL